VRREPVVKARDASLQNASCCRLPDHFISCSNIDSRKKSLRKIYDINFGGNMSCPVLNLGRPSNQARQRLQVRILFLRLSKMQ
jgi:hypothetical protein